MVWMKRVETANMATVRFPKISAFLYLIYPSGSWEYSLYVLYGTADTFTPRGCLYVFGRWKENRRTLTKPTETQTNSRQTQDETLRLRHPLHHRGHNCN